MVLDSGCFSRWKLCNAYLFLMTGNAWHSTRMCPMLNVVSEQGTKTVDAAEMAS